MRRKERLYYLAKSYPGDPQRFEDLSLHQIGRTCCRINSVVPSHVHTNLYELTVVSDGTGRILTNGVPITEVSEMLNYASVYSFGKAFHKRFGVSPRAFRMRCTEK